MADNDVSSVLRDYNTDSREKLLYVENGSLKVWDPQKNSMGQRFVIWITGRFDKQKVATAIFSGLVTVEEDQDIVNIVDEIRQKFLRGEDKTWFLGLFISDSKHVASTLLERLVDRLSSKSQAQGEGFGVVEDRVGDLVFEMISPSNLSEQSKLPMLQARFDVWLSKQGNNSNALEFLRGHVEDGRYLALLDGGQTIDQIEELWSQIAKDVNSHRVLFAKKLSRSMREFIINIAGNPPIEAMLHKLDVEIIPKIVADGNAENLIDELIEQALVDCLNRRLDQISAKYKKNFRVDVFFQHIRDNPKYYIDLLRSGEDKVCQKIDEQLELAARKEVLLDLFLRKSQQYRREYGADLEVEFIQNSLENFVGWFDKYGDQAISEIESRWNTSALEAAKNRNRKNLGVQLKQYNEQYPFLNLEIKAFPEGLLKISKTEDFEPKVREWVAQRLAEHKLAIEIQNSMSGPYEQFWSALGNPSFAIKPSKLVGSDAEEVDMLHREAVIKAAVAGLKREYGLSVVIGFQTKDLKDFAEMGGAVNLAVLEAIFPQFNADIKHAIEEKKSKGEEVTPKEVKDVFNQAIRQVAKELKLDPEQVLNGEVPLTGYSKEMMKGIIPNAVLAMHGNVFQQVYYRS